MVSMAAVSLICRKCRRSAVAHLQRFTKNFSGRFMMMVERTHFTVFGNPSDELRGLLDQFGATYI
jgi:hypothetical protein